MKRADPFILAVWVACALALASCTGEPTSPEPQEVVAGSPDAGISSTVRDVETSVAEPWRYDPIGKRDPYRPYDSAPPPNTRFPITDLQRWELDQLRLVGIVRQNGHRLAMLEDPEGRGHIVHAGDYVGTHWGQVTAIDPGQLVITEYVKDDYGRTLPLTQEMQLADPWGEG